MTLRRTLQVPAAFLAVTLAVASCGSDDEESKGTGGKSGTGGSAGKFGSGGKGGAGGGTGGSAATGGKGGGTGGTGGGTGGTGGGTGGTGGGTGGAAGASGGAAGTGGSAGADGSATGGAAGAVGAAGAGGASGAAGADGSVLCDDSTCATIVINEVQSQAPDYVEFYNAGTNAVDISTWTFISDDPTDTAATFPANTVIAAGGYLTRVDTNFTFGLGSSDTVTLHDGSGATQENSHTWNAHAGAGNSWSRCPNGSTTGTFSARLASQNAVNNCP